MSVTATFSLGPSIRPPHAPRRPLQPQPARRGCGAVFQSRARQPGRRPRSRPLPAPRAAYEPYPWQEEDFYEAGLQLVQGTLEGAAQGALITLGRERGAVVPRWRCRPQHRQRQDPRAAYVVFMTLPSAPARTETPEIDRQAGAPRAAARPAALPTNTPRCCARCTPAKPVLPASAPARAAGFLLVMRTNGATGQLEDEERGLVLAVGGDTMRSISLLTQRGGGDRPLALDLLWQVGQEAGAPGGAGPQAAATLRAHARCRGQPQAAPCWTSASSSLALAQLWWLGRRGLRLYHPFHALCWPSRLKPHACKPCTPACMQPPKRTWCCPVPADPGAGAGDQQARLAAAAGGDRGAAGVGVHRQVRALLAARQSWGGVAAMVRVRIVEASARTARGWQPWRPTRTLIHQQHPLVLHPCP